MLSISVLSLKNLLIFFNNWIKLYNIIIKPLLKLYEKEVKISSQKYLEFFKEECKPAFKLWLSKESKNTETVKDLIYDFHSNDKFNKLL